MGHEFLIEVEALEMFAGHAWSDLGDECPHSCEHRDQTVIAWGPTTATYELVECGNCGCRAWLDGRYHQHRLTNPAEARYWASITEWRCPLARLDGES